MEGVWVSEDHGTTIPAWDCYFEFLCHSIRIQSLTYNLRDQNMDRSYIPPHPSGSQVLSHYHLSFLFFSTHCHCADPGHLHLTPIPLQVLPGQPLCYSHSAIQSKALFLKCTPKLDRCAVSSAVSFFLSFSSALQWLLAPSRVNFTPQ